MGRLTKIYRDKKDDPYRKLLEQLTREDELEGCILVTVKKTADKTVEIELHKGAKQGHEASMDSLGGIFSLGFQIAYDHFREEQKKQSGGGKMRHTHHIHVVKGRAVAVTVVKPKEAADGIDR